MQNEDIQNESISTESAAPADVAPSSTPDTGETSGESSKETMLDAVLQVVKPTSEDGEEASAKDKEEAPASDKEPEEKDQAEGEEGSKEETDDQPEDDEKAPPDVSPKARTKINKLLKQRRELRDEVTTLKPNAEIGAQLQNFTQVHDLSSDDVVNALHIAATLRRGDYGAFYEMVAPYVRHAQEYLGVVLPQDLQQMVEQQQMTEQAAAQFARVRFDQQRTQIENQRMNDMGQQYVTRQVQGNVAQAVSDYEGRLAANDPDWKAKAGLVHRAAGALLRERGGTISSVDEAIQLVKAAYDEVNAHVRKFAPPPRATALTPNATNSQTPASRAAPKNMMEAALAGLARSRAG